jgi:hypothetical protein
MQTPPKPRRWTQVLSTGKQSFLLYDTHRVTHKIWTPYIQLGINTNLTWFYSNIVCCYFKFAFLL